MKNKFVIFFILFFSNQINADIYQIAGSAVGLYSTGVVLNAVAADGFEKTCSGGNAASCAMLPLTLLQMLQSGSGAAGSRNTRDIAECVGDFCGGNDDGTQELNRRGNQDTIGGNTIDPTFGNTPSETLNTLVRDAQRRLNDLERRGFEVKDNGDVKLPSGKVVRNKDLQSAGAMAAAGFSPKDIEEVEKIKNSLKNNQAANKLLNQIAGEFEAAQGGGRKKESQREVADFDYKKFLSQFNANSQAGSRGVAGLEKKLGRDSIGVSQDNIFLMITRRYQNKKSDLLP